VPIIKEAGFLSPMKIQRIQAGFWQPMKTREILEVVFGELLG
jgi:hypothetical protein